MVFQRREFSGVVFENLMELRFRSRTRRSSGGGYEFAEDHAFEAERRERSGTTQ
jgi:hypothetical protein